MDKKKIKKFVNEHKIAIISAGAGALGVTLCIIGVKAKINPRKIVDAIPDLADNVDIPTDFAVGEIAELWKEGEWLNAIVNNVTTTDLGRLGEEFVKHGIVPDETKVSMIIGFI